MVLTLAGCVVSASEEEGAMVTVGTVITVYIAADPSVQITATPEEPAAGAYHSGNAPRGRHRAGIRYRLWDSRSGSLAIWLPLLLV